MAGQTHRPVARENDVHDDSDGLSVSCKITGGHTGLPIVGVSDLHADRNMAAVMPGGTASLSTLPLPVLQHIYCQRIMQACALCWTCTKRHAILLPWPQMAVRLCFFSEGKPRKKCLAPSDGVLHDSRNHEWRLLMHEFHCFPAGRRDNVPARSRW
jgi:hypothetical protein